MLLPAHDPEDVFGFEKFVPTDWQIDHDHRDCEDRENRPVGAVEVCAERGHR
jgi:hypothetical protein